MLGYRHALIDLVVDVFELNLGRMLKLLELNDAPPNYIYGLHESLHTLPHICNRLCELVVESRCQ